MDERGGEKRHPSFDDRYRRLLEYGCDVCSEQGRAFDAVECVDMDEGVREERKVMSKCRGGSI
jgi:hypothetical protein